MVGERGLEPPRISPQASKTCVSTNFTTRPLQERSYYNLMYYEDAIILQQKNDYYDTKG